LRRRLGTYSFFASHTVTCGEGGAIVTDDDELAELCRALSNHGRLSGKLSHEKFTHDYWGYNAKMDNLTGALALAVIEEAPDLILRRRDNFLMMNGMFDGRFVEADDEWVIPHGYPLQFTDREHRDIAFRDYEAAGVECRRLFSCIPMEAGFNYNQSFWPGDYPTAEYIGDRYLYLPCHQNLTPQQIDYMANVKVEGLI